MAATNELGRTGELLAGKYLMDNGYRILHRNWKSATGYELDIVAYKDDEIHFIEVKTRSDNALAEPESAIDKEKIKHISACAMAYVNYYRLADTPIHFDSVGIVMRAARDYDIRLTTDII